jgi:hypothetical protein
MVWYIYGCNYIKFVPMKSRSASQWVKAYGSIHEELTVKGFKPNIQTLSNEASTDLKNFLHLSEYRLSTGSAPLPSTQRCGTRHQDFQKTLCDRALLS